MSDLAAGGPTSSVLVFRRRALAVVAGILAVGMSVMVAVLAVAVPGATTLDLVLLAVSVVAHWVVAVTVGRRWEPGGAVNVAYVFFNVVLIVAAISQSASPAADTFWTLLAPVVLAAITLSTLWQATVTVLGLTGYLAASAVGPGIGVGYASQRSVALVVFAVGMWFLARQLVEALGTADAARAELHADVEQVTTEKEALERLDTARDDYVSSVSHELRTPLTVILGMTRTLHERWDHLDDARRRHMTGRVVVNATALDGIVSALLDLTRIERGGLRPAVDAVHLRTVVRGSVERLETVLQDHDVRTDVPTAVRVQTDARLLDRVLDNLLTNAARHTPAGTTVMVVAQVAAARVRIAVSDDGPGIAPADVDRLGQQFFRAGSDPDVEGLGLGLALVVEVLRALDEELEVVSEPGAGTTFSFTLPRAAPAAGS